MILHLKDVVELIEEIAPHELAEPWDNPGLQIGAMSQEVETIYFALDPVLNSLKKAIKYKADLLITHHPLIFRSISILATESHPGNVIKEALKNDIGIISAHTNLDSAPGGLNDILAEMLELEYPEVLKEIKGVEGAGIGRVGNLRYEMSLKEFIEWIKKVFGLQKVRIIWDSMEKRINRVAIVGGSGGSVIPFAIQKKADILITGDIGYHDALNAIAHELILIDVGHFSTESTAYKVFGKKFGFLLKDRGFEVKVILDEEESDPFLII